jgi:hypothetical protein
MGDGLAFTDAARARSSPSSRVVSLSSRARGESPCSFVIHIVGGGRSSLSVRVLLRPARFT